MYDAKELARNAPGMAIKDDGPMIDMVAMREYRLGRLQQEIRARDCAAAILFSSINIRYATGTRSGQIFGLHTPGRAALVPAQGKAVTFGADIVPSTWRPETIERHQGLPMFTYFPAGSRSIGRIAEWAKALAAEIKTLGAGMRVALDMSDPDMLRALEGEGLEVIAAEPLMEHATVVKSPEEVACLIHAVTVAETGMARMRRALEPGMTESELFAVLEHTNIEMGGEWLEYRLLGAGGHINPWGMEAGDKVIRAGELVAFDCGLIGPFGYSADISRTFFCEPGRPSDAQRRLYGLAYENIQRNLELIKAGVSFRELSERSWMPPDEFVARRYPLMLHGIGMGDEWPSIPWPIDWDRDGYDGVLEENMVICVESYIGSERGGEGVKLEDQILVTKDGYQLMSTFPFESDLLD